MAIVMMELFKDLMKVKELNNVILNLILIPDYGGAGAAYASLGSWMISVFLLPIFSQRTVKSVKMFFKTFNFLSFTRAF